MWADGIAMTIVALAKSFSFTAVEWTTLAAQNWFQIAVVIEKLLQERNFSVLAIKKEEEEKSVSGSREKFKL